MYRVVFYNLQGRYAVHAIVRSRAFDPEFRAWCDEELEGLGEFDLVVIHQPQPNPELVKRMRQSLHFANIQLVVFIDNPDPGVCRSIELAGDDELVAFLEDISLRLQHSENFENATVEAFKLSTMEIFTTMAFLPVEHVQSYHNPGRRPVSDLNASMHLMGHQNGAIMLSLPEDLARRIISSIMATPLDEIGPDVLLDGVGELVNMIAGGAKARLSDTNILFTLSTPSVVFGQSPPDVNPEDTHCVVIVFRVDQSYLAVQVCMPCLDS